MITREIFKSLIEQDVPLTREQEYLVFEYYESHKTKDVRNMICEKNVGLARMVSQKIAESSHMDADDVFQEAFMGLMAAVDKFDKDFGVKFSTYAFDWIKRAAINYVLEEGNSIRLPYHVQCDIRKIIKAENEYRSLMRNSLDSGEMVDYVKKNSGVNTKRIDWYYSAERTYGVTSLNKKISADDGDECELMDLVGDRKDSYAEYDTKCDMRRFVELVRDSVSEAEFRVISLRFGLYGNRQHTIRECAFIIGLSEARTKAVLSGALEKIKKYPERYGISEFHNYIREVS